MQPMSLHHLAHVHSGRNWGGGENQVLQLLLALRNADYPASLVARPDGELFSRAAAENFRVFPLPSLSPFARDGVAPLLRALRASRVDLVHAHDSTALDVGRRVARRLSVPLVYSRRIASPLRRNPFSRAKYSPRNIDLVIAVSETVKSVFSRDGYPASRIVVAPDGLDVDQLSSVQPDPTWRERFPAGHLVCGVGRLSSKKNWRLMVQTAAELEKRGEEIHWLLAGDGPEREALEQEARALGIERRVHFLGFCDDILPLLKSCDLLFFPSLREGASVTVREAMLLGVPVVSVDTPGSMESLDGHGWIVPANDPGAAASAVAEALNDTSKRDAMRQAAYDSAVERFAFQRTLDGTLKSYGRVVSGR